MKVRSPYQAGAFYEDAPENLKAQIKDCFFHRLGPGKLPHVADAPLRHLVGLICPHAGYTYSGPVAAHAFYELAIDGKPETVVLFGPNHSGYGSGLAIMNEGIWKTPLGNVQIDTEIANQIVRESGIIDVDDSAHVQEHSIEVQLPFLQFLYGSAFRIVPICFLMQDLSSAREVGQTVGKVLTGKNAVIIASSDMSHYVPKKQAEDNDGFALSAVEKLDDAGFFSIIESERVTACGPGPIAALITASRVLGVKKTKLLCYKTSGDVIGDSSNVVGYAAVSFMK